MKFVVLDRDEKIKYQKNTIYLIQEKWDNSRYKTLFTVVYRDDQSHTVNLDYLNIGFRGMENGKTISFMKRSFESLPKKFFSLGASEVYYLNLSKLPKSIREEILESLNDMSYCLEIFDRYRFEKVVRQSFLISVTETTIRNQFHRVSRGGALLTPYKFSYTAGSFNSGNDMPPITLDFSVIPDSNPPTNIHVIIGRNGTGKTNLLKEMIQAIYSKNKNNGEIKYYRTDLRRVANKFANVLFVSFCPYDDFSSLAKIKENSFHFIGLNKYSEDLNASIIKTFLNSFIRCMSSIQRIARWKKAIEILETDNIFEETEVSRFESIWDQDKSENRSEAKWSINNTFSRLSAGHKIILLIITTCVDQLEEKTILFIDEPENHLHPPLLSAFIRALSYLLIDRNGTAIISTHSPVVLQEVPRSCVWKIRRNNQVFVVERINTETFGASISLLFAEVFGLEISDSGFHGLLKEVLSLELKRNQDNRNEVNYSYISELFNDQLGNEAQALVRVLLHKEDDRQ